jgi:enoyl-CoA hydratase/carnithine racemase
LIVQVSLNRPNKLNALNMEMFRGIVRVTKELQQDRDVAAVILRGEGRAFCAGLDFKNVLADPLSFSKNFHELMDRDTVDTVANLVQAVGYNWKKVPAPVLCVTHGVCFGGGTQFTCFTGTKVQILTLRTRRPSDSAWR